MSLPSPTLTITYDKSGDDGSGGSVGGGVGEGGNVRGATELGGRTGDWVERLTGLGGPLIPQRRTIPGSETK